MTEYSVWNVDMENNKMNRMGWQGDEWGDPKQNVVRQEMSENYYYPIRLNIMYY